MNKTRAMVGIAGAGGIGSNVAAILVRAGVMHLKIIDHDRVEQGNLDRQFYYTGQTGKPKVDMLEENLKKIDSNIDIAKEMVMISRDNIISCLSGYDIIVEGFDKEQDKIMLMEELDGKKGLIVSASGIAGDNMDDVQVRKLGEKCHIVGDFSSSIEEYELFFPKILTISAIMSGIVLKYIKGIKNERKQNY